MDQLKRHPVVQQIEQELEGQHAAALTYALRYGSGWDRVQESFRRLQAFKEALGRRGKVAQQEPAASGRQAA